MPARGAASSASGSSMADADPRRVVHADLDAGLPDLRARTRGERVQVFWWSAGVPVGQDELRVPGPPPRVLADRVATAVATHGGRGGPAAGAAPRVAVAILVSGPAQPPERCLAALFADREQPDAVLVVDRGRRGAGAEPVARFPQVEVARTPGGSDGAARNLAVVATSSEIVAFLDADAEPQ